MDFLKIMNFQKNLSPLKKELDKICFIYYYKITHIKKLLSHLRQWFISAIFISKM